MLKKPVSHVMRRTRLTAAVLLMAVASALGIGGCSTLDERQRQWIFQPPEASGMVALVAPVEGMTDVWIDYRVGERADTVRLHGLWMASDRPDAPVVLHLHGARRDARGSAHRARRLHALGFSVLTIDYRGFGRSSTELPSEQTAAEDAAAAWAWLGEKHPGMRRFVFGHSLGGAIAVRLAAGRSDVAGLMLEGTFTSIADVARQFRWGWLPFEPLITQRFDSASRIAEVKAPLLVVHGTDDRVIAPALGRALFERATVRKRFVLVEGGSHHNTMASGLDRYREAIAELFGMDGAAAQLASAQDTGVAPSTVDNTAGSMATR